MVVDISAVQRRALQSSARDADSRQQSHSNPAAIVLFTARLAFNPESPAPGAGEALVAGAVRPGVCSMARAVTDVAALNMTCRVLLTLPVPFLEIQGFSFSPRSSP